MTLDTERDHLITATLASVAYQTVELVEAISRDGADVVRLRVGHLLLGHLFKAVNAVGLEAAILEARAAASAATDEDPEVAFGIDAFGTITAGHFRSLNTGGEAFVGDGDRGISAIGTERLSCLLRPEPPVAPPAS